MATQSIYPLYGSCEWITSLSTTATLDIFSKTEFTLFNNSVTFGGTAFISREVPRRNWLIQSWKSDPCCNLAENKHDSNFKNCDIFNNIYRTFIVSRKLI